MNKTAFLQHRDINGFVDWLVRSLPGLEFRLFFSASRFVPGGLNESATGIEAVLACYVWSTSWNDEGQPVRSSDWHTTKRSLQRLRTRLRAAADAQDDEAMLVACMAVLEWGGVTGAKSFLRQKAAAGQLVTYLERAGVVLELAGDRSLEEIGEQYIERYDAGLTKIHALLDATGAPIYDSRVGAAIAMFYALYRAESGTKAPQMLRFPSGRARGVQARDPRDIDARFAAAPQFYTAGVTHQSWAQSQVKLGWIMREVLARTSWFASEGDDLASRAHAFEAALFVVGYDLRCIRHALCVEPSADKPATREPARDATRVRRPLAATWVPTSHPFETLFASYVDYRKELGAKGTTHDDVEGAGFRHWLDERRGPYTSGTLHAYCYPFKPSEFDLFGRPLAEIVDLHTSFDTQNTARIAEFLRDFALDAEERRNVCLIDAWCVGYLKGKGYDTERSKAILIGADFAGTPNAAATLLGVGRNVGRVLGLLDRHGRPTQLFDDYFRDTLDDLARQLDVSASLSAGL